MKELTYNIVQLDPPEDSPFDLEAWLADLLVEYWLLAGGEKKGKEYDQ